jgi:hypothetical protein
MALGLSGFRNKAVQDQVTATSVRAKNQGLGLNPKGLTKRAR